MDYLSQIYYLKILSIVLCALDNCVNKYMDRTNIFGIGDNKLKIVSNTTFSFKLNGCKNPTPHQCLAVCECSPDKIRLYQFQHLQSGHTKSCGCHIKKLNAERLTTHGKKNHPLYSKWKSMVYRCKKNIKGYGQGIDVCQEWIESIDSFIEWSEGNGYEDGLEIDRIDGTKGYNPSNCRFVTRQQNIHNTKAKFNKYKGVSKRDSKTNPWIVRIKFNYKSIYVGVFKTEKEGAIAYNKKAKELYGEHAYLNKIEDDI